MPSLPELCRRVVSEQLPLCIDSRKVTPGAIFVARPGLAADGARFIPDAIAAGASVVVCRPEYLAACAGVEAVPCDDPNRAVGELAAARYDTASLPFPVVGVTGTNGKTTVTYLLEHLFAHAGFKTGVIGTVACRWPGHCEESPMTTPDSIDLHAKLAAMRAAGVGAAFMEVSSHALDQHRVDGVPYSGAVFTNLTQDHLDYHQTLEAYFEAKVRLFTEVPRLTKAQVMGVDSDWGRRLYARGVAVSEAAVGYGLGPAPAGVQRYMQGTVLESGRAGLRIKVAFEGREWETVTPLIGGYNAENILAAEALGLELGLKPEAFACFEDFCGVCGRLERIRNPRGLDVFVDYAHTPDALVNMLGAVRGAGFARIFCVFGCGGNRDRTKRPLMGEAVARLADVAVLTSDNPRHEDPLAIIDDVRPGLAGAAAVLIEPDRRKALALAVDRLRPGDALVVAGKGHENMQIIGDVKHPFSDQQVLREILGCA